MFGDDPADHGVSAVKYRQTLRGRLSLFFLALFAIIVSLGVVSVWSLGTSNEASTDVRDRWLPNTRLLGDLNNFTSDYRTAEADILLASDAAARAGSLHDLQQLDQQIIRAQQGYERIHHDEQETGPLPAIQPPPGPPTRPWPTGSRRCCRPDASAKRRNSTGRCRDRPTMRRAICLDD